MPVATRNWEETLRDWSKPSSATEAEKCERAERMIKQAISEHDWFTGVDVRVYPKGSYANNTNVRIDSDVDIAVELKRSIFFNGDSVPGFTPATVGIWTPAPDTFAEFKLHVYLALVKKFGLSAVDRGNKAFDVHENTSRVDADVVPCWEYRHYYARGWTDYHQGEELIADDGLTIINWAAQQNVNGNGKNIRTGLRYKFITRTVKRLRNEMAANGIVAAEPIPSYLIECLMYNVPDGHYGNSGYLTDVKNALAHIAVNVSDDWLEVNEMKRLFRAGDPRTVDQVKTFALAALFRLP